MGLLNKFAEKVIVSHEVRICDIGKPPFNQNGWMQLQIPKIQDYRKYGLEVSGAVTTGQPILEFQILNMTRIDACWKFNPNRNIIEDRPIIQEYGVKELNTVILRTKIVINLWFNIIQADRYVFNFFFPRFSIVCWVCMHWFFYYFDGRYILTYLIILIAWLVGCYSPWWKNNITPLLERLFFQAKHLHPELQGGRGIDMLHGDDLNYMRASN